MGWITPVYDRTVADVEYALTKIQEWKEVGATNTSDLKGCFNLSDMNRIENNIKYLSDTLTDLYYFPTESVVTKTWDRTGLPTVTDINRLIQGIRIIISSYYPPTNAPELPTTLISIEDVNSIERNLYRIKVILDNMLLSIRECDTFYCGEE